MPPLDSVVRTTRQANLADISRPVANASQENAAPGAELWTLAGMALAHLPMEEQESV